MYCSNCGVELTGSQNNFCPKCGTKLGDAVQVGMFDFEVVDDTTESIEKGMLRFETKGSYATNDLPNIQQKISSLYETIEELSKLWLDCLKNFSSIEIDFYRAVKYKLKEGTKLLLIKKQEHWDEWYVIMNELKTNFDEALYLLSILKPKLFDNSEKKMIYRNAINTFEKYALQYNAMREFILEHYEIKFLENDN